MTFLCDPCLYSCGYNSNEAKLKVALFGVWDSATLNMKENYVVLYHICYPHAKEKIVVIECHVIGSKAPMLLASGQCMELELR